MIAHTSRHHSIDARASAWNDSLAGDYLWSNVNFGEAVTEVMTPLTWSVIQFTLKDWTFLPGMPTVGVIGGRPYLNISIFATLFYGMGCSQEDLLSYMESTLYLRLPEGMPIPQVSVSRATFLQAMLLSTRVQLKQRRGVRQTPAYLENNPAWFERTRKAIQSQSTTSGLHSLWQTEMKDHILHGVWCVLGSVTHSADYTLSLRRRLAELVGAQDANLLIANLSGEHGFLESLGPLAGLQKLAHGEISRAAYLEAYGHRGPNEFELSLPRPAEDAAWLDQEVERIARTPADVDALLAQQRKSFQSAWQRLELQSPGAASGFRRKLAESARRARRRELARSAYTRDRWAIRLFALRAAELTGLAGQVFFLTLDELLALLAGDPSVTRSIESRINAYQSFRTLPPYPPVIRGPFDPFKWAADADRQSDIFDAYHPSHRKSLLVGVRGSPGSAGIVEGAVRIIDHLSKGNLLRQGEILVAQQTDIAWTLLFPRAAGIITDIGAPLSHAAIVARELGIPAVVGCGNATAVLKTGDRVRIDGGQGTVEILEAA